MRYIILVSHGTVAPALENAMSMIIGKKKNVLAVSMQDGMGADVYLSKFRKLVEEIKSEDQILLLGDLAEGSPMTNAVRVLAERDLMKNTIAFAGMNLPMVITAAMLDDGMADADEIEQAVLQESRLQLKVMKFGESEDDEEI